MMRIDARGMRCPWPAVRLARALRDGADAVEIVADDSAAPAELAAVAARFDCELLRVDSDLGPKFRVTAAPGVNRLFTQIN